ncbi:hypothetical protein EYF80_019711 [Liparis tanakae]|uniref:Uncharacterized protein n=1 Tax=Liparis tanakae TaxID=230148 RepID=A0A4Z2HXH5_9TELE|nr:hypothetical protein EYF80_019711 [Liparis tanakae]
MVQSVRLATVQVRWSMCLRAMPPSEASQPISSNGTSVLQFTVTESPYRTTTLGGLNSMGQACTPAAWSIGLLGTVNTMREGH